MSAAGVWVSRQESVPVSVMLPPKVSRSTMAAAGPGGR